MNSTFVCVLLIICIVMCASIVKTYLKQRAKEPQMDEDLVESLEKIDLLEERIRVLERIITENRYDLKNEIDSL